MTRKRCGPERAVQGGGRGRGDRRGRPPGSMARGMDPGWEEQVGYDQEENVRLGMGFRRREPTDLVQSVGFLLEQTVTCLGSFEPRLGHWRRPEIQHILSLCPITTGVADLSGSSWLGLDQASSAGVRGGEDEQWISWRRGLWTAALVVVLTDALALSFASHDRWKSVRRRCPGKRCGRSVSDGTRQSSRVSWRRKAISAAEESPRRRVESSTESCFEFLRVEAARVAAEERRRSDFAQVV